MNSKNIISLIAYGISSILTISCTNNPRSNISYHGYKVEGNIQVVHGDTLFEGPIKFFDTLGKLNFQVSYLNNKRNGQYLEYNDNGSLSQKVNYENGLENGLTEIFDSAGTLIARENFFHGVELGPQTTFSKDTFKLFKFVNFDNIDWYRCEWDSSHKILETGDLLQYTTTYYLVNGKLKLVLFLYLINPPQKHITYQLFDKNSISGDSTLLFSYIATTDTVFRKIYMDPPGPNHIFLWNVEAFYPKQDILIKNIQGNEERALILPHSRN